jgi:hypothetical protein
MAAAETILISTLIGFFSVIMMACGPILYTFDEGL